MSKLNYEPPLDEILSFINGLPLFYAILLPKIVEVTVENG